MIIDVHAHVSGPNGIWDHFREVAVMAPGMTPKPPQFSDQQYAESLASHLGGVSAVDTDLQVISGRPWSVPTFLRRESTVIYITQQVNNMYDRVIKLYPDRFVGMVTLPQVAGVSPRNCIEEIERCVHEFGFVGVRIIQDPSGTTMDTPDLSDEWWYPLYEKMVELDLPALIHGGPFVVSREPELGYFASDMTLAGWALLRSPQVFRDFPNLKIIVGHGSGYVPYHLGLAHAQRIRDRQSDPSLPSFEESMQHFYSETVLYDPLALEVLVKAVGVDHVLFGSDRPANGDVIDPNTGHSLNDMKFYLDNASWVSDADRHAIYEGNARRLFPRLRVPGE